MKSLYSSETIVALSTPLGAGAIAVIRVSGDKAFETVHSVFRTAKRAKKKHPQKKEEKESNITGNGRNGFRISFESFRAKKRHFGFITGSDRIIDEVVLSLFYAPYSYTGEDIVEVSCHCNPFIIREIMQLLLKKARLAKPGEFTQRAFINNRIDLTGAEAVGDLLNARTELSHRAALSQLEGNLYRKIKGFLEELTSYRIELELEIDFVEQDVSEIDVEKLKVNLQKLSGKLRILLETGKEGIIIRDGLKVCLTGSPNVGKSSLFNHLLSTNRAIVTPVPGTTRDYLEETLSLNGYPVRLYDTAGLRVTTDDVESIGIARTMEIIDEADRIIYLEDGSQALNEIESFGMKSDDRRMIKVLNKSDILPQEKIDEYREKGFIICSVKTGSGIDELKRVITKDLVLSSETIESGILSNMRQIEAVEKSLKGIDTAVVSLEKGLGFEFTAFDLKEASEALEEIIGRISTDDILNRIFAEFCIGK